jgi:hypothetical protein
VLLAHELSTAETDLRLVGLWLYLRCWLNNCAWLRSCWADLILVNSVVTLVSVALIVSMLQQTSRVRQLETVFLMCVALSMGHDALLRGIAVIAGSSCKVSVADFIKCCVS